MHRGILEACWPLLIALAVSFAALVAVVRLSGARFDWHRLRRVHACQQGGVQSLAFVLTLPVFIMIVQFIVQVSQLMIGVMVVHYAAYAGARAASVWIPAQLGLPGSFSPEPENRLSLVDLPAQQDGRSVIGPLRQSTTGSYKLEQIRTAVVLACAPVAPSRDLGLEAGSVSGRSRLAVAATQGLYRQMVPTSVSNARIDRRLANKITYSDRNTAVFLEWRDARNSGGTNTVVGPTYNPRNHPYANTNPERFGFKPNEVGWQDAVTVHVVHNFALLPGPGRLLAQRLVRADGLPDRVSSRIQVNRQDYAEPLYTVAIPASATMTNEGIKSQRPYVHEVR